MRTGATSLNSTNPGEIRKFGIIGFLFFGTLLAIALWRDKTLAAYFFGILSCLSIGFIVLPLRLRHAYAAWLKIANFVGLVVTTLILSILFYFVITPTALIKKILGGRPLPLKPDDKVSTYWITRTEPAQPKERFPKRF
jgi:hypothetical protein